MEILDCQRPARTLALCRSSLVLAWDRLFFIVSDAPTKADVILVLAGDSVRDSSEGVTPCFRHKADSTREEAEALLPLIQNYGFKRASLSPRITTLGVRRAVSRNSGPEAGFISTFRRLPFITSIRMIGGSIVERVERYF